MRVVRKAKENKESQMSTEWWSVKVLVIYHVEDQQGHIRLILNSILWTFISIMWIELK